MPTPTGAVEPRSPQLFVARSAPVMPVIDPPVPAEPVPVTARWPLDPVLISTIPWVPPFAVIDLKVRCELPIVVFSTSSAVPVPVVIVLFAPVTVTVPPLVAAGPAPVAVRAALVPVERVRPPLRLMVAPVLALRRMPLAVLLMAALKATVPPVLFWIWTGRPPAAVIVPG